MQLNRENDNTIIHILVLIVRYYIILYSKNVNVLIKKKKINAFYHIY